MTKILKTLQNVRFVKMFMLTALQMEEIIVILPENREVQQIEILILKSGDVVGDGVG